MVTRVFTTEYVPEPQNPKQDMRKGLDAVCTKNEVWNMEAETICAKIADGKAAVCKATMTAIKHCDFALGTSNKISSLIKAGFTVYVVNTTDYRKIKNLYERTYA
jgi:hypothetical protein